MASGTIIEGDDQTKMDEPYWRGRLRLMKYAIDNPDMIYAYFSGSPPYHSKIINE